MKKYQLERIQDVAKKLKEAQTLKTQSISQQFAEVFKTSYSFPKFDFSLLQLNIPKFEFNLPKIEFNIPNLLDDVKIPNISESIAQVITQNHLSNINTAINASLKSFSRNYQSLINSNLPITVLATSLKKEEIALVKQFKFDLPEFPKINLPKQTLMDFATMLNENGFAENLEHLRNTYVGNLSILMREAILESSDTEEAYERIESLLEEKLSTLPETKYSREFIISVSLSILLFLISILHSQYLSLQTSSEIQTASEKISVNFEKQFDLFLLKMEQIENLSDDETYYLVQRTTSVKNHSNFKSLTIHYLSKNSKVRLLKRKHRWIYIEFIDEIELVPRNGWISKKYLKIVK